MSEQSEKNATRNAVILVAVVIVVAAYCLAFGLQTLVWVETHHWASKDPWINDVPESNAAAGTTTPAPDAGPPESASATAASPSAPPARATSRKGGKGAAADAGPAKVKAYDYEFKSPWPGNVKPTPSLGFTEFRFDAGQIVVFFDPESQADMLRTLTSGTSQTEYNQFRNVFVGESFNSNYDIYNAVYSAAPKKVSPFMPLRDAIRVNQLVLWKISFGYELSPGIRPVSLGSNRGFEFGDPSNGKPVVVRVFDGKDVQFRLIFLLAANSGAKMSQSDVDSAVRSLQSIPLIER